MSMTTEQLAEHIKDLLNAMDRRSDDRFAAMEQRSDDRFSGVEERLKKIETATSEAIKSTHDLDTWKAGVEGAAKGGRLVIAAVAAIGGSVLTTIGIIPVIRALMP